ncbi:putative T7SS-secreted protein [Streptomyces purpurascens]|uniref:putative T7SS-secreted protein n=1 Tax=Streptomyces purpurascens TaxID=1924 RepID=UPI00167B94F7|nr:hypothetical protein [Streptomyces purpurascens]MCE7047768.1 hypothetical protein [Streptomyces purpurascens]GHA16772.1 hypothetical protein GCM10010303_28440 [Streptomyces purpurascens]
MARPPLSEWEDVFGFTEDPTPGDPEILEQLASEYRKVSHDADDAGSVVSRLDSKDLGEGKSMEELRNKLGELPDQVGRLQSSYEKAAAAVKEYATRLRESQEQADKALRDGREAKDRLASAVEVATAAGAKVTGLDNAEAPPPDDEAAKSSARRAMADAKAEQDEAARSVESAEADLEAARRLALDAQELRVSDAGLARRQLDEAEAEAVEGKSTWDKIWDIVGAVLGFVAGVLGVLALFIPGLQALGATLLIVGLGAASLGITIAKAVLTGEVDIVGIVLGVVGLAFGGAAIFNSAKAAITAGTSLGKALSGIGRAFKGAGTYVSNVFKGLGKPPPVVQDIPLNTLGPLGNVGGGVLGAGLGRFATGWRYVLPGMTGQIPGGDLLLKLGQGLKGLMILDAGLGFKTIWYGQSFALPVLSGLNDSVGAVYGLITGVPGGPDGATVQAKGDFPLEAD